MNALNETYKATDRSQYNHHPENGARGKAIMEAHNIAVDIFKANGVWHQKGFGTSLNLAVQKNVIVKNSCLHQALAILNDTVNMGPRHDPSHSQSKGESNKYKYFTWSFGGEGQIASGPQGAASGQRFQ